jgi:hypothetical protein
MAAGPTYEPIETKTGNGSATSFNFASIPQTYTDLVLVINGAITSSSVSLACRYNGDSGNNYSFTRIYGIGSGNGTGSGPGNLPDNYIGDINGTTGICIFEINNYSNSTTYKTGVSRYGNPTTTVQGWVNMWRNTNAITSINVYATGGQAWTSGSTLTLYGITAA